MHGPLVIEILGVKGCQSARPGDRWLVDGCEVRPLGSAKLCASLLAAVLPHVRSHEDDSGGVALNVVGGACIAQVTIKPASNQDAELTRTRYRMTRRLEQGAQKAGERLQEAGPFLTRVPPEVAADLVSACTTKRYRDGELILEEGAPGERLYIVGDGDVEVVRRGEDHSETVLVVLGMGECFGEMSLLTGEPTSAAVRARGNAAVLSMTKETLEQHLLRSPELNRVFSKLMADRLRLANRTIESELGRGILGKLSMISAVDLVQTLNASRRTGTLVLSSRGQEARVNFRDGQVVQAELGNLTGEDAFYSLITWPDGDFCFETQEVGSGDGRQIATDTMGLLMESMRRLDELKR